MALSIVLYDNEYFVLGTGKVVFEEKDGTVPEQTSMTTIKDIDV